LRHLLYGEAGRICQYWHQYGYARICSAAHPSPVLKRRLLTTTEHNQSPLMAAVAMAPECGFGKHNCKALPMNPAW